jgi:hypothetical protein
VDLKSEVNHWDVPVWIEIILYKSCAYDIKFVNDLKKGRILRNTIEKDGESFFVTTEDIRKIIQKRSYSSRLKKQSKMTDDELAKDVDSVYFINNIINSLYNLRIVKVFVSNSIYSGRVAIIEDQEVIMLEHSVEYGVLNLPQFFTEIELESFNKVMVNLKYLNSKYIERSPYFKVKAADFLSSIEDYITEMYLRNGNEDSDEKMGFLDKLFALIDPKLEEDNTLLLVLTDYKNL